MNMNSKRYLSEDGIKLLHDISLRDEYREKIKEIKGKLVKNQRDIGKGKIISVGDRVTISLIDMGRPPDIAVIDLREKRKINCSTIRLLNGYLILTSKNPPGTITSSSWDAIYLAIRMALIGFKVALIVEGEEDLLGFPSVILAPDKWVMVYGQPNLGMISVVVDRFTREKAIDLLHEAFLPI